MPKYKGIIVLISIIGVIVTSCSQTGAPHVDQTNNKTKEVKSEDTVDDSRKKSDRERIRKEDEERIQKDIERKKREYEERERRYNRKRHEIEVIRNLNDICMAQAEFKKLCVKDQNKNGIGEYASNTELINLITSEKEKKSEVSKRLLPGWGGGIGEDGNLFCSSSFCYRVFIPEEPEMQEQYWLAMIIVEPKYKTSDRRYFYYNKMGMIFYTDEDLIELYKNATNKAYKDPWTLRPIFFGEPFYSPINTALWKVLDSEYLKK